METDAKAKPLSSPEVFRPSIDDNDDEGLPLYQESVSPPPLPDINASPAEVREFIYLCLVRRARLDEASAQSISSKWNIGTGQELRKYTVGMYRDVFGSEPAWLLYKIVRTLVLDEENGQELKKKKIRNIAFATGLAVLVVCFVVGVSDDDLALLAVFSALAAVFVGVIWLCVALEWRTNEKQIEYELQAGFATSNQTTSTASTEASSSQR